MYEEYHQFEMSTIVLHRRTKTVNAKYHVDLLKIGDDKGKCHYVFVKDYNKLVGSQTNNHKARLFHCRYCQHGFKTDKLLTKHLDQGCLSVEGQSVKLPEEGSSIEFNNHNRKFKCPFTTYGDFECLTTITGCFSKPADPNKSYTNKYPKHAPRGF